MSAPDEDSTFKILLATDCHLGFMEKDPIRGNDSFVTFEEILIYAQKQNVDFILFGGDLFHENKPSRHSMHVCMQLLRKYCFGNKPVEFQFVSDQSVNFQHNMHFPIYNCDDPNLNVGIPVFSIHGNHDDPTGAFQLASLDLLSTMGVVNYFGKMENLDLIDIQPLLMKKGETSLALYGIGSLSDERLHRLFRENKVKFRVPKEDGDSWFNMLVLHQNRVAHGPTNYIPEQFLDNFLDLVLWGHEHECRIEPEMANKLEVFITQPGSSIATSLCPGEAVPKHVGLLEVNGKQFKITPLPLKTVRPFYLDDICLAESSLKLDRVKSMEESVMDYCGAVMERLLEKAAADSTGHPKQPKEPLIRLRVEYTDEEQMFKISRFGQRYVDTVANFKDIVKFNRKRGDKKMKGDVVDKDAMDTAVKHQSEMEAFSAVDLVTKYFEEADDKMKLSVLTEKFLGEAIRAYVNKDERDAISALVRFQIKTTQQKLLDRQFDDDLIVEELVAMRNEDVGEEEEQQVNQVLETAQRKRVTDGRDVIDDSMMDDDVTEEIQPAAGRGRGRGRGRGAGQQPATRGSRGSRGARGGAAANKSTNPIQAAFSRSSQRQPAPSYSEDDEPLIISDSDDDFMPTPSTGRARGSSTRQTKASPKSRGTTRPTPPSPARQSQRSSSQRSSRRGVMFDD